MVKKQNKMEIMKNGIFSAKSRENGKHWPPCGSASPSCIGACKGKRRSGQKSESKKRKGKAFTERGFGHQAEAKEK